MRCPLVVASLFICLASCSRSLPPTAPTPAPQPANHLLSGTVFEIGNGVSRAVADQFLAIFIQETEGLPPGMTMRTSSQYTTADANGRYVANVPKGRVFVSAVWGKRQPCLASALVSKDTTLDVQVFSGSSDAPTSASPMVTGFIYETTSDGRKPVRGAHAWLDLGSDMYIASTETDAAGGFYFCRVSATVRMDVSAEGFQPYAYSEFIPGTGDRYFEFEFKR